MFTTMPQMFFSLLSEQPNVSLSIDANTLLFGLLAGLFMIVGFLLKNHMDRTSSAIDRLDERVDKMENRLEKIDTQLEFMINNGIK